MPTEPLLLLLLLFGAGLWAGAQNALAGGGSFVTLPALIIAGLDPKTANLTSTIALFPGQAASGWAGRDLIAPLPGIPRHILFLVSLLGGALGALLLLATSSEAFERIVPWLVLLGTLLFARGSFFRPPGGRTAAFGSRAALALQFGISIYGGYFGGGIGFLMMPLLTMTGMAVRNAGGTKNALAAVINASAVLLFIVSGQAAWLEAAAVAVGAVAGGLWGVWLLKRINVRLLQAAIVAIGGALTIGLFIRAG